MAHVCELTHKGRLKGNRVSHANNRTTHYQQPNLKIRQVFIPELGQNIRMKVSASALRTIDKVGGIARYLIKVDPEQLSPRLKKVRKLLLAKGS